jgi:hypothetical protein
MLPLSKSRNWGERLIARGSLPFDLFEDVLGGLVDAAREVDDDKNLPPRGAGRERRAGERSLFGPSLR